MSCSAISIREAKKAQTLRRIQLRALELTREHGLEGWTMDDLADAAEVSRRTLFNYVPGKIDAVIGSVPELPEDGLTTFVGGGPTGDLVEDLGVLAGRILDGEDFDPALLELRKQVFAATPRLVLVAHDRFHEVVEDMSAHILAREGLELGEAKAGLLVRMTALLVDTALQELFEDPDGPPLSQRFLDALRTVRELLREPAQA